MTDVAIMSKLEAIVRALFDEYEGPIGPSLSSKDVAQWDSLANVQFAVMVEQALNVRFATDEVGRMKNLGEVADLVARKKS